MSVESKADKSFELFGRREITTPVDKITRRNLVQVMEKAVSIHKENSAEIDYLYWYERGKQPILSRTKEVRPEINNRIVENHAAEITQFTSAYFLGEPVTYVRRGDRKEASDAVGRLNDMMFFEKKASHDKRLATWMSLCGHGYRMVLPDKNYESGSDEAPFTLDIPDPRHTFVVYHSGFGHARVMGVREVFRYEGEKLKTLYCGYTKTHYFEVMDDKILTWKTHTLYDIPIYEYRLNMFRLGSFEPAIPLLNAINTMASNRVDGVEQFVQSFLKFINCEVDEGQDSYGRIYATT